MSIAHSTSFPFLYSTRYQSVYSLTGAMAMLVLTGDTCRDMQAPIGIRNAGLLYLSKTSILCIGKFQVILFIDPYSYINYALVSYN